MSSLTAVEPEWLGDISHSNGVLRVRSSEIGLVEEFSKIEPSQYSHSPQC